MPGIQPPEPAVVKKIPKIFNFIRKFPSTEKKRIPNLHNATPLDEQSRSQANLKLLYRLELQLSRLVVDIYLKPRQRT